MQNEKTLFIKTDKHVEINELIKNIAELKIETKKKLDVLSDAIDRENKLIGEIEESLKKTDGFMEEAESLINSE